MTFDADVAPLNFCGCPDENLSNIKRQKPAVGEPSKRQLRVYYKCDCHSESEANYVGRKVDNPNDFTYKQADAFKAMIKRVNGTEPETCPWRSSQSSLMRAIYRYEHIKVQNPNAFNDTLPNILYEAIIVYEALKTKAFNHWFEVKEEKRKVEAKMRQKASRTPSTKAR